VTRGSVPPMPAPTQAAGRRTLGHEQRASFTLLSADIFLAHIASRRRIAHFLEPEAGMCSRLCVCADGERRAGELLQPLDMAVLQGVWDALRCNELGFIMKFLQSDFLDAIPRRRLALLLSVPVRTPWASPKTLLTQLCEYGIYLKAVSFTIHWLLHVVGVCPTAGKFHGDAYSTSWSQDDPFRFPARYSSKACTTTPLSTHLSSKDMWTWTTWTSQSVHYYAIHLALHRAGAHPTWHGARHGIVWKALAKDRLSQQWDRWHGRSGRVLWMRVTFAACRLGVGNDAASHMSLTSNKPSWAMTLTSDFLSLRKADYQYVGTCKVPAVHLRTAMPPRKIVSKHKAQVPTQPHHRPTHRTHARRRG
jgi:hypothetical protein